MVFLEFYFVGTLTGKAQHVHVHCWIIQWHLHVLMCWDYRAGKVLSEICLSVCITLRTCFPSPPLRPSLLFPTHVRSPVQASCFSPWLFSPVLSLQSLRGELSPSAGEKLPRAAVNLSPPRGSHHPSKPHHKHHLQTDNKWIKHSTPMATAC